MYQNPNVMKYIYDGSVFLTEKARERVDGFAAHWQQHSFGMWLFRLKNSDEVVGYGGLRYFEDGRPEFKNQIELGYIIDEPYWGIGFAQEAVSACVQAGLNHYHRKRILATILPDNIASQKVAERAGMQYAFDADFDGLLHYIYEVKTKLG